MELGGKLKKLRKENDYSQQQVAEILHITAQAVSKWENNKSVPDITTLVQITDLYNVSLDYLIKSDKQLQNKLSIKNIRLRVMNLITIPFILVIILFVSMLIKAEFGIIISVVALILVIYLLRKLVLFLRK